MSKRALRTTFIDQLPPWDASTGTLAASLQLYPVYGRDIVAGELHRLGRDRVWVARLTPLVDAHVQNCQPCHRYEREYREAHKMFYAYAKRQRTAMVHHARVFKTLQSVPTNDVRLFKKNGHAVACAASATIATLVSILVLRGAPPEIAGRPAGRHKQQLSTGVARHSPKEDCSILVGIAEAAEELADRAHVISAFITAIAPHGAPTKNVNAAKAAWMAGAAQIAYQMLGLDKRGPHRPPL